MADYTIVGAGVSGLSLAVLLAEEGHRVTLLEQGATASPTLHGFCRQGVYFDTGVHYLGAVGKDGLLRRLLDRLGIGEPLRFWPMGPCFDTYRAVGERELCVYYRAGRDAFEEGLGEAFPCETRAIRRFCTMACEAFPELAEKLLAEPNSLANMVGLVGPPTLSDYLRELTDNVDLRRVLSAHTVLHGTPPDQVPLNFHAMVAGSFMESAHYVEGGGRAIVNAFCARLEQLGVTLRCRSRVTGLDLSAAGAMRGLRLADGSRIETTRCIATVHPRLLLDWVPESALGHSFARRQRRMQDSACAHVVYGIAPAGLPALRGRNLILDPQPEAGLAWQWPCFLAAGQVPDADPVAFSLILAADGKETLAQPGSAIDYRSEGYRVAKDEAMRRAEAFLREHCQDELGTFSLVEGATALTFRYYTNSPNGGLYGIRHTTKAWGHAPTTGIDGLFLSGQAVMAPGVLGAAMAAFVTCGRMPGCGVSPRIQR
ncbi:MAG: NAD(P)/FAD-dependent oxidoreductase [Victivallales bacterium]|jgi:all-trans-retinol 13,14-reductase|nr:NAD(P)/FAD-dependent oxidoreductase [Victivallales bacterium]